jgi:uncharacterized damage-inducible protein DinB
MTSKEIILAQLSACHNEAAWFVPVNTALAGLTEEQALQKDESNNSIMQIVIHLIFWDERYLNRFVSIPNPKFEGENKETFEPSSLGKEHISLSYAKEKLNIILSNFHQAVKEADEEKLNSLTYEDRPGTWLSFLGQITIHNAYHIGQIVTIRKQHGNWNPELGVD